MPGLDRPFRHMAVTHQTPVAIIRHQIGLSRKRFGDLDFDRLRPQGARHCGGPRSVDRRSRPLAQGDDPIRFHGVSILVWTCGWLTLPLFAEWLNSGVARSRGVMHSLLLVDKKRPRLRARNCPLATFFRSAPEFDFAQIARRSNDL